MRAFVCVSTRVSSECVSASTLLSILFILLLSLLLLSFSILSLESLLFSGAMSDALLMGLSSSGLFEGSGSAQLSVTPVLSLFSAREVVLRGST